MNFVGRILIHEAHVRLSFEHERGIYYRELHRLPSLKSRTHALLPYRDACNILFLPLCSEIRVWVRESRRISNSVFKFLDLSLCLSIYLPVRLFMHKRRLKQVSTFLVCGIFSIIFSLLPSFLLYLPVSFNIYISFTVPCFRFEWHAFF